MAGHVPWDTFDVALRASRTVWLATASADGQPQAVPFWFTRDGETAWFVNRRHGHRPELVLYLVDGDEVVPGQGRAGASTDPETVERVERVVPDRNIAWPGGTIAHWPDFPTSIGSSGPGQRRDG